MSIPRIIDSAIYVLVIASIVAIILESDKRLIENYGPFFRTFEFIVVLIFSAEYIYRTIRHYVLHKNFRYNYSVFGIIDLIAIVPYFLPLTVAFDPRTIRILSLLRTIRVLKMGRHSEAIQTLFDVFLKVRAELALTAGLSLMLITFCGIAIFYVENPAQPAVFNNMANSIWWALSTLTTVGYGDIYPITALGKLVASVVAFIGIGLIAIPTGLISATYLEIIREKREEKENR